mgnify:CR=1 FL=1
MALTDFSSLTNAQKKVWSTKVWREGRDQAFWFVNGFMGRDTGDATKPVQRPYEARVAVPKDAMEKTKLEDFIPRAVLERLPKV